MLIEIEGMIGVGKTTLMERLAQKMQCATMREPFVENPFLERFYPTPESRARYGLAMELDFLRQTSEQHRKAAQRNELVVADYHAPKTQWFAEALLPNDELDLFRYFYRQQQPHFIVPTIQIRLTAPTDLILKRIQERGREMEKSITREYLDDLQRFYGKYDDSLFWTTHVMQVDTTDKDYRRDDHFAELYTRILEIQVLYYKGRQQ